MSDEEIKLKIIEHTQAVDDNRLRICEELFDFVKDYGLEKK